MADEETAQAPAPSEEAASAAPEPIAAPSEPLATPEAEVQTAQIPADEPFDSTHHDKPTPAEPEPAEVAHDKPTSASEEAPGARTDSTRSKNSEPSNSHQRGRDLLVKARATIQDRKHKKLEKILEFLNTKGKITNDEVEKLLHVSDATATRYLSALEKEGKIKQVGKTGKAVEYTRI